MNGEGGVFNEFKNNKTPFTNIYELFTETGNSIVKERIKFAKKNDLNSLPPFEASLGLRDQCVDAKIELELIYCQEGKLTLICGNISCSESNSNPMLYYKQFYMGFIDNLPLGIYRTGVNGTIHYVSKKFVEILGYESAEEIYQANVKDFFVDKNLYKKKIGSWAERPMESFELKVYKKDGSIIWVKDSGRIIKNEDDEIVFLDGILEDITTQKENEIKLKELNNSKDLLFSIISHDLRTPFNQFIGGTELLLTKLEEYDKNMLRKFLTLLNKEAIRSYRLLENLLQWSKMQRGLIKFDPKPVDLLEFVKELMGFYESIAEEKNIDLHIIIPNNLHIYADKEMLSTILRNLVSNALKFTQNGGEVKVTATKKIAAENIFSEYLEVSVADNGIGIRKESISSIFSIDKNESDGYRESSTGLGLLLCKDFVEKHNGTIWVESEHGKGSTFFFTIK